MEIGFGLIPVGIGIPITPGVGRLFIMDDGFITRTGVGCGFRIESGVPPGSVGVSRPPLMDGPLCLPEPTSRWESDGPSAGIMSVPVLPSDYRCAPSLL